MAWVTAAYLVYLFAPMLLLLVGSFGEVWFGTLLPTGATLRWYAEVINDPSFRRAFWSVFRSPPPHASSTSGDRMP